MRKKCPLWLGVPALALAAACGDSIGADPDSGTGAADYVVVAPASVAFDSVGQTAQLHAVAHDSTEDGRDTVVTSAAFIWSSSDPQSVHVSASGLVTAMALGSATITAQSGSTAGHAGVTVAEPMIFTDVRAGGRHACGLTSDGRAVCWGSGAAVGNGSTFGAPTPVLVAGGLTFTSVSSGSLHTCATTASGRLYCWGDNGLLQLGGGWSSSACHTTPHGSECSVPVPVPGSGAVAVVSAGGWHTCSVTLQGAGYCWGASESGALGIGPIANRGQCYLPDFNTGAHCSVPLPVIGGISFATVIAGASHTCGIATDGAAWCWGRPYSGSLGVGLADTTTPGCRWPIQPLRPGGIACQEPLPVAGGLTFASLSTGAEHTCGVTPGGALYCWGRNSTGQLGNGTVSATTVPTPSAAGLTVSAVSAGLDHTCALTTDGKAWCWGATSKGRLGNGLAVAPGCVTPSEAGGYCSSPVQVAGNLSFTRLSASTGYLSSFTCGVTVTGAAYCWGSGALGNGNDDEWGPECVRTDPYAYYCSTPQRVLRSGS